MGKYNRDYLELMEQRKESVGSYRSIPVYSCSKKNYKMNNQGYWVIYDDGNKLIKNNTCIGKLREDGQVENWTPSAYIYKEEKKVETPKKKEEKRKEEVDFFAEIDKQIEKILNSKIENL